MTIRLAVIGAGIMGSDHAHILANELPGAQVQMVCDASTDRAQALADAVGAADVMSDAKAAIARSDVDAVVIASPDFTHAPLSLACIRAGKPVLCEKPVSQSANECLTVMQAEQAAGHHKPAGKRRPDGYSGPQLVLHHLKLRLWRGMVAAVLLSA